MQCQPRRNPQDVDAVACSEIPPWRRPLPEKPLTAEATAVAWAMQSYAGRRAGAKVSPELGIEKSSDYSDFPVVIRVAGSEWAARRRDGQGATHSTVWSITPATADTSPAPRVAGQGAFCLPWTAFAEPFLHEAQTRSLPWRASPPRKMESKFAQPIGSVADQRSLVSCKRRAQLTRLK